jgi:hypothetical protein
MTESTGFLDDEALRRLTGWARANDQEAWLKREGLPYKRGKHVLVLWVHVQAWIEGRPVQALVGPDFSSLEEPQLRLRGSIKDGRSREARQAKLKRVKAEIDRLVATSPRKDSST